MDLDQEFLWQCQKQASFWLWRERHGKMTRGQIRQTLEALPEAEREETRKWLNHYSNLHKEKNKHVHSPTISRNR